MYPTNDREGFAFMCLKTGRFRHSKNWTQLPITDEIIQRVETIAKDLVNVKKLMEEIDDYVNEQIMKGATRQEELQNDIYFKENTNEESSDSETESTEVNNDEQINLEDDNENMNGQNNNEGDVLVTDDEWNVYVNEENTDENSSVTEHNEHKKELNKSRADESKRECTRKHWNTRGSYKCC